MARDDVRRLREETGAGVMDCKRALDEAKGDFDKAKGLIKERGLAKAKEKADRIAKEGVVEAYVHAGGRIGAMVELNCETDFVARDEGFRQLAREIAMQIAATAPEYVAAEDAPADLSDEEKKQKVLLLQGYIRNERQSLKDLITERTARYGENVRVGRFTRFELGA